MINKDMACIAKKCLFDDINFKNEWRYHNPRSGFSYNSGSIPGYLLFSEIDGNPTIYDILKLEQTLNIVYSESELNQTEYIRIVDYSKIEYTNLIMRKVYSDMMNRLNKKYSSTPVQTWICGANDLTRTSILLMSVVENQQFLFSKTVQEAIQKINSNAFSPDDNNELIQLRRRDLDQIGSLFGNILHETSIAYSNVSSSREPEKNYNSSVESFHNNQCSEFHGEFETDNKSIIQILESIQAGMHLSDQHSFREFEIKLFNERQRLSNVIEGANIGTWELNIQTGETIINERWGEIIGYTIKELSPFTIRTWSLLVHPEDLTNMTEALDNHLAGKSQLFNIEYRMLHKDGHWMWIHARGKLLARTADGKPLFMNGTHTDITDRKQYEKAIQENNDFLEDVFHSIQDGVFVLNEDFTIRHQNNILKSWYHNDESYTGKKCHVLFHNSDKPCDECPTVRCFKTKHTETAILTGRKNSTMDWVEVFSYPLKNRETGKITGAIVLTRDISRRKCAEEQLRSANLQLEKQTALATLMAEQARKASDAKSEFLANMSHEIRTPMNGLIGITSLLFETSLNEEQQKYVEIIRTCSNSLLTLINDILDFSKIEAGRLEIESIDFDLCVLIKNFAEMIAQRGHEKKIEFIIDFPCHIPHLLIGDPHRLQQILTNLVGNAIKFTQEGEIIVSCEILQEIGNKILLKFSIKDSGIGIAEEKQKFLFNKFTQVDNSATRRYGGTGLGLAISKQLAMLMGGEIGVKSPLYVSDANNGNAAFGSEFWFTASFIKQSDQKPNQFTIDEFNKIPVLIIDKNKTFRQHFNNMLTNWGFHISEAANEEDADNLLLKAHTQNEYYKLIFISNELEKLPGLQFKQQLLKQFPSLKSKFILVTTSTHDIKTGEFSAVLQKPLFPDSLFMCIRSQICPDYQSQTNIPEHQHCNEITFKDARILLVEDNLVNQKVAMGIMKKWNLEVQTALNGIEALEALSRQCYNLVLMDVQMPDLNGYETTQQIRSGTHDVLHPDVPIIAMTAHTMNGDKEKCLEAGMNDYISKPFNVDQLFSVLNKWLQPKRNNP
jgi:PAS domain S-box-containing protein